MYLRIFKFVLVDGSQGVKEGFVVVRDNRPTKFVDRADFSAANFNKDKNY